MDAFVLICILNMSKEGPNWLVSVEAVAASAFLLNAHRDNFYAL
jgi:hypothetical protein